MPEPPRPQRRRRLGLALAAAAAAALVLLVWRAPVRRAPATPAAPSPVPHVEGAVGVAEGRLFLFGGFWRGEGDALFTTPRSHVYDPDRDTWERRADVPILVTHVTAAWDGAAFWLAGGFEGDHPGRAVASVWRYEPATDRWSPGPALPAPRAGGALVHRAGRMHYFGGFADRDDTRAEHWELDLAEPSRGWRPRAPLPEARGHLGGALLDGAVYAVGGQLRHDSDPVDLASVRAWEPKRDAWTRRADLPTPRSHFETGIFSAAGRIVVAGGRDNTRRPEPAEALDDVIEYDPQRDRWRTRTRLPARLLAPVLRPFGERWLLTGGSLEDWRDPRPETWWLDLR